MMKVKAKAGEIIAIMISDLSLSDLLYREFYLTT